MFHENAGRALFACQSFGEKDVVGLYYGLLPYAGPASQRDEKTRKRVCGGQGEAMSLVVASAKLCSCRQ